MPSLPSFNLRKKTIATIAGATAAAGLAVSAAVALPSNGAGQTVAEPNAQAVAASQSAQAQAEASAAAQAAAEKAAAQKAAAAKAAADKKAAEAKAAAQKAAAEKAAAARAAAAQAAAAKAAAEKAAAQKAAQERAAAAAKAAANRSQTRTTLTGTPQQIAAQLVPANQLASFGAIISHESGWNVYATNASSGAYGLAQALPGSKMASAGSDWRTSAATQIKWALNYMNTTYGSPNAAWAFWQTHHWY